jgi:hypothetical protein
LDVNLTVTFANHVLLNRFCRPALRVTIQTLMVLKDDKVKILGQCFQIDDQMADVLDEESMGLLHVDDASVKGFRQVVAEKALLRSKFWCFFQDGRIARVGRRRRGII